MIAYVLIALGGVVTLAQWAALISAARAKRSYSTIPLVGGLLLFVGAAMSPVGWKLALFAFALDPGCWILAYPVVWVVSRARKR